MHTMSIIHRDIKTLNILLEPIQPRFSLSEFPYRIRLCDFGISRIVTRELSVQIKGVNYVNVFGLSARQINIFFQVKNLLIFTIFRYAAPEVFARMQLASAAATFDPSLEMQADIFAFGVWYVILFFSFFFCANSRLRAFP